MKLAPQLEDEILEVLCVVYGYKVCFVLDVLDGGLAGRTSASSCWWVMSLSFVAISNSADRSWEDVGAVVVTNIASSVVCILVDANGELAIPAPLPP